MISAGYVEHRRSYRFERDNELSRWTLEFLCEGQVLVRSLQGRQLYRETSVMLVPPRVPYSVEWHGDENSGAWRELYVVFDPPSHWSPLLSWPSGDCGTGIIHLPNLAIHAEVESSLHALLQIQKTPRTNRKALLVNSLERALLMLDELNPLRGYRRRDERIEQALENIAACYDMPLTLGKLAREVYLSPSRFSHLFQEQMQIAPMRYLEQYRLDRAAEKLLSTEDSIEQIAATVGFSNPFHFSTRFRLRFGKAPSRYRTDPKNVDR